MESRIFPRVEFSEFASVRHEGEVFFCDTENVSLQGLFIKTDQDLPLNTEVEITIYHSLDSSLRLIANAVHRGETGLGMQIKRIDILSFVRLWGMVAMQCNGQDIMRETQSMTGCIQ